ncbi:helix-turn-helix domain-containing protein [Planctomycetes bacterium TBK1r]|uniref:Helix-turn-helix domain protein n=1 Tax=Stieleria magnilauensis TaxID=2527963 RepID=A0ABX5Y1U9_9BACT|nr:hypothetical protein TBK1r_62040 [Planctomycetes bacterium TBK1r]
MIVLDDELIDRIAERIASKLRGEFYGDRGNEPSADKLELIDADTLADRISLSRSTIDRMTRAGRIPSVKAAKRRLYDLRDVVEALKN